LFLLTEVSAKVVFAFILGVTTLASGFVIRPYENNKFDIPGGDKSLDLEEIDAGTDDKHLPTITSTTVSKATTIPHTTTTDTYDTDDSYDEDCDSPPQFLIYIYGSIN